MASLSESGNAVTTASFTASRNIKDVNNCMISEAPSNTKAVLYFRSQAWIQKATSLSMLSDESDEDAGCNIGNRKGTSHYLSETTCVHMTFKFSTKRLWKALRDGDSLPSRL